MTDNIVNSEHEMSTAKSLCYMAPPALVSKCQPEKNGEKCQSVPPSSPLCRPRYVTNSPILVTAIVYFLGFCSNLKFYEWTLTSVRTVSLPIYSPLYSRIVLIFCWAIILSGSMNSWLWCLYFLESFGISKFMYTHRLMFKSGFVTALQLTIFRVSCP